MVSRVTYRPFIEDDFEEIARILQEAWHTEVPSEEYGFLEACNDLAYSLSISSFSQVALVDGVPRGIVLARPEAKRVQQNKRWFTISKDYFRRMRTLEPEAAAHYWRSIELTGAKNDKLIANSAFADANEITLLAVSKSARGMGLGGVLADAATSFLSEAGASKIFLYTDTDCTWQFYEHRGFKRAGTYRSTRDERRLLPKELYVYGLDLSA
ncbi:MAG: GNAT family N-acetyltransferase [Coriobacteriaceae bacterium]|nr:GNAT family N-acetyltransferase [Coriobacteriaceae bacterium]